MTEKQIFGQAYQYRDVSPRRRLRERLLDICEHLLVLIVFLIFLSFVQSLVATQQELDTHFTALHGYHPVSLIEHTGPDRWNLGAIRNPQGLKHART